MNQLFQQTLTHGAGLTERFFPQCNRKLQDQKDTALALSFEAWICWKALKHEKDFPLRLN